MGMFGAEEVAERGEGGQWVGLHRLGNGRKKENRSVF